MVRLRSVREWVLRRYLTWPDCTPSERRFQAVNAEYQLNPVAPRCCVSRFHHWLPITESKIFHNPFTIKALHQKLPCIDFNLESKKQRIFVPVAGQMLKNKRFLLTAWDGAITKTTLLEYDYFLRNPCFYSTSRVKITLVLYAIFATCWHWRT